jgi:hypothetical protein
MFVIVLSLMLKGRRSRRAPRFSQIDRRSDLNAASRNRSRWKTWVASMLERIRAARQTLFRRASEQWFRDAHFKVFCAKCWDEAKRICGGFASP